MGDLIFTGQEFLNLRQSRVATTLLRSALSVLLCKKVPIVFAGLASILLFSAAQAAEPVLPLILEATIPLPNVAGRIDHLAVDLARKRLFVAEVGNNTLDAIDLATQKSVHRIAGLDEPQGVVYLPEPDLIAIGNGGDGAVRFYSGMDFSPRGVVSLGDDADNVRVDPRNGHIIVGYGSGGLAIIDPLKPAKLADIPLTGHPESFRLSLPNGRIFVNVARVGRITSIDLASGKPLANWSPRGLTANFPMSLDETRHAVIVVFRSPAKLALFDMTTGAAVASADTCGDSDDVFFDEKRGRIYVSCGAGFIDVFQREPAVLTRLMRLATTSGARTSLFVPELDRLFLAVRAGLIGSNASIQVYRPNP
jgi:DNA-binding beta-propeller fold protein YncE